MPASAYELATKMSSQGEGSKTTPAFAPTASRDPHGPLFVKCALELADLADAPHPAKGRGADHWPFLERPAGHYRIDVHSLALHGGS